MKKRGFRPDKKEKISIVFVKEVWQMGYHSFKTYVKTCVKYVLFFIFLINLVGTAHADTGRLVHYNWTEDNGNTIIDNSGHGNDGINNGTTTFILSTGGTARHFNGQSRITIPNSK